ncbi:MAG TPA: glycosyl hydrolase family 28 protein [Acidobacteriaceae bacterium]|nr:glycosyl hydrolase family 28 protein [Acidobacteriaceae bacterium]
MRLCPLIRLVPAAVLAPLLLAPSLFAQDTRSVAEPKFPAPCAVLDARLSAPDGSLPAAAEKRLDTARIQAAIDACAPDHAVELRASRSGNIFLTGPLQLRAGVTLLVDRNAILMASREPRLCDLAPGSCGVVDQRGHGCKPLILAEQAPGSGIMEDGAIDGRGGARLPGRKLSWWDLAHIAQVRNLQQSCFRLVVVDRSDNFVLHRIRLRNSPSFHVLVEQSDGFTVWGVKISTPRTARNTDGIDPASSANVAIVHSWISDGDDDVAIKAGTAGPATHMAIADDHFYCGHGMSIGSETNGGVSAIRVRNLTIDGADNGIRIKSDSSRGGLVENVSYDDVCMRNVRNPILLTPHHTAKSGDLLPDYRDITLRDVHIVTPGRITLDGLDRADPLGLIFENVLIDGLRSQDIRAAYAQIALGPALGNLVPAGDDVRVSFAPGSHRGTPPSCSFPDFPAAGPAAP